MALAPGQTSESFIKEVDENLRRSQAENFAKRWGKWLIALAALILIATAGYLYWRSEQAKLAAANSEAFSAVLNDIGQNKSGEAGKRLETIAGNANDSMAAAARLTRAAVALQDGDRATAIAQYTQVADDGGTPQAYRDAALIRRTQLEFDTLKPEEVIARMQKLAVKENAWFGSAAELTALAMVKANRRAEAARLLQAVAADKDVPATLKARTGELASSLSIPVAPAAAAAPTAPAAR